MPNFLKGRKYYGKNQTGRPSLISSAEQRQLILDAANNFKLARLLKVENNLSVGVRSVQQIFSATIFVPG